MTPGVHGVPLGALGHHHRVTHSQQQEELPHVGAHGAEVGLCSLQQLLDVEVVEVLRQPGVDGDNRPAGGLVTETVVVKVLTHYGTTLEHHFVLCVGPGLVTEHELNLAELLGNVEGTALCALVVHRVIHQLVIVNQVNLHQLDNLDCDIERQGDDDLKIQI